MSDSVTITVYGRGGHGAMPHNTVDPIVLASRIVLSLQTIVSRENNPIDPVVITVGSIHGGTQANIIPDEVRLQLSVRTYTDEVRTRTFAAIRRIARGEATSAGAPREPLVETPARANPPVYNDPTLTLRAGGRAEEGPRRVGRRRDAGEDDLGGFLGVRARGCSVCAAAYRRSASVETVRRATEWHSGPGTAFTGMGARSRAHAQRRDPRGNDRVARVASNTVTIAAAELRGAATLDDYAARFMVVGHGRVLQRVRRNRNWVERPKSRPISWSHRPPTRGWRLPAADARSRKPKGALTSGPASAGSCGPGGHGRSSASGASRMTGWAGRSAPGPWRYWPM